MRVYTQPRDGYYSWDLVSFREPHLTSTTLTGRSNAGELSIGALFRLVESQSMAAAEIDNLFARTLEGEYDDDVPWQAVESLRRIGTREVFERAARWVKSEQPLERARGLDVLAQIGKTFEHPSNNYPQESYDLVSAVVQHDREFLPLRSAIAALGHLDDPRAVPLLTQFHSDPNPEIRFSVACALGSFANDALSVGTLITMTHDSDEDVRDWATFGVGVLGDTDSFELRDALCRRLRDANRDVREEAMAGLAKRLDIRVLPALIDALGQPEISDRVIEAAYTLLGMDSENERWSSADYLSAIRERFQV